VLLGVVLVGLIATSWLINRDALRQAVEAQIRAVTGLELTVKGPIDVSVFPGSYVSFHDVGLKGGAASDPALRVDVLTANLRLLPLLLQRFEIADLMMLRPQIHVARWADGESNWTPFIETIARTMKPGADNQVSFSEIRIQDGTLDYEDAGNHASEKLEDIDLSLAWPSISRSFAATGQFDWRGERVDGSISISDFVAALSGDRSGLKARLASAPLKLAFDGTVANRTSAMMEGTLTVDSTSLRNALRWTGQAPPGSGGFGRFALKARANLVGASVALTNVNVELDGNVAEGVMTYSNSGRQSLQATLAADSLDFTPYISTFRLLAGGHDWNRQLFDLTAHDLRRHMAYGVEHLRYYLLNGGPDKRRYVLPWVERGEIMMAADIKRDTAMREALILAMGNTVQEGKAALKELREAQIQKYVRALESATFTGHGPHVNAALQELAANP